jgi:hypothetical protein
MRVVAAAKPESVAAKKAGPVLIFGQDPFYYEKDSFCMC